MIEDNKPSIAELQRMHAIVMACEPPQYVQAAISALVVTTPVLLEIAAAAQEHLRILDDPMSGHRAVEASRSKLREALAKVRP